MALHTENPTFEPPTHPALGCSLLLSGADYFPALLAGIEQARQAIWLESYIFAQDATGQAVKIALLNAARRGVTVHLVIDGFGSGDAGRTIVAQLLAGGVNARIYRPQRWYQAVLSLALLRRLHRKLCLIDPAEPATAMAFVGGINLIDDFNHAPHTDPDLGPRFDFAMRIQGSQQPALLAAMERTMRSLHGRPRGQSLANQLKTFTSELATHLERPLERYDLRRAWASPIALIARDNVRNRRSIETMYLKLLGHAQREVWLAHAYFLPGAKLRRALLACAARGVRVRLLLQGRVEYPMQHHATQALYGPLLKAGIEIYEYTSSFLHAKVCVVDGTRLTLGSSNIDPFSLLLAREANVLVHDPALAQALSQTLQTASLRDARRIDAQQARSLWQRCLDRAAYGLLRLGAHWVR